MNSIRLSLFTAAIGLITGSFAVIKENRILEGLPASFYKLAGSKIFSLSLLLLFVAFLFTFLKSRKLSLMVSGIAASSVFAVGLTVLGKAASRADATMGELSRVSPGYSFWIFIISLIIVFRKIHRESTGFIPGKLIAITPVLTTIYLLFTQTITKISVFKEYENNRAIWQQEFLRHIQLSIGSVIIAIIIGSVLAYASYRLKFLESLVFLILNIAQVIPTLSFIGLLMPVLGKIGETSSVAQKLNIKGTGWAPALVVLVFYALYPITRNMYAALRSIDKSFIDISRGIGLNWYQRILLVELPMSLPVVIAGVKVALIQASAGTIIASLVGAGGLGIFIFLGLAQTAQDLVLLGAIPIVLLSFLYSALAEGLNKILKRGMEFSID